MRQGTGSARLAWPVTGGQNRLSRRAAGTDPRIRPPQTMRLPSTLMEDAFGSIAVCVSNVTGASRAIAQLDGKLMEECSRIRAGNRLERAGQGNLRIRLPVTYAPVIACSDCPESCPADSGDRRNTRGWELRWRMACRGRRRRRRSGSSSRG